MSINEVSQINFFTETTNPTAQISIDGTGDLLLSPATDAAVLFNNLSLSGTSSSDPTATITADASGDIILTPASGAMCIVGGVEMYTKDYNQYIQSNGFSNLYIGNGDENSINLSSTSIITLNGIEISNGTTITTTTAATDLYIGSATVSATNCSNIGICATDTISLNYININSESSPTIQPSTSTDSITLSANTLNFTPSAGYLRMSQTPYFTGNGNSAQTFTLPCGGVFLLTMVANITSGDQVDYPSVSDMWYVFSTATSNTISPYSSTIDYLSGYYAGINANGIIGVESSSTSNEIGVGVYQNDAYFYNFYLTMIS
jgi:hypothetical protein